MQAVLRPEHEGPQPPPVALLPLLALGSSTKGGGEADEEGPLEGAVGGGTRGGGGRGAGVAELGRELHGVAALSGRRVDDMYG